MIALTDSQWIDMGPFVLAFVVAVVIVNVALIVGSVWCAFHPPRSRRVSRRQIERACTDLPTRNRL